MNIKNALLILFVCLSLSSCALVRISDAEWCGDMGVEGASCFHTISDDSRDMTYDEWNNERFGMLCTKADNFAEWKKVILKLCKVSKRCSYDDKNKIIRFENKVKESVNRGKLIDLSDEEIDGIILEGEI